MKELFIALIIFVPMWLGTSSAFAYRYPVMGCYNFQSRAWDLRYAPYGRCALLWYHDVGLYHERWKHWGRGVATGRGYYYDGLGFLHPAQMWIYGLRGPNRWNNTCDPNGRGTYSVLHVVWQGVFAGAWRPAGDQHFDVVPDPACYGRRS